MRKIALILAGGKGTRLWPLSRQNYPKQFVEFSQGASLFQLTLKRLLEAFAPQDIFIISQENYRFTIYNQLEFLPGLGSASRKRLKENLIFEPCAKSTLPAVLLAIKSAAGGRGLADNDLLYVFPSDHIIQPVSVFKRCLNSAARIAGQGKIVVFGVKIKSAHEGYGYVLPGRGFKNGFLVKRFIEKPALGQAKALLKKGALCNAGIFCFSKKVFLGELKALRPDIFKYAALSPAAFLKAFKNIPAVSLDYGIMQKTGKAALVKFGPKWSDLGSWDSLRKFYHQGKGNLNIGKAEFLESEDCFSYSPGRLVCLVGLKGLIAVDSPDALLLMKKGSSDKVRELVSRIDKKGYPHTKDSSTVYRPWGYYTVLHEGAGYKVKEIGIYPGRAISLQKHRHRSEHWNVVQGKAEVLRAGKSVAVARNESIFVPAGTRHRVHNPTGQITKIIEVQIGSYLGEDDIQRFSRYR